MARRIRVNEYHPSNPKIDVYFAWKYRYSTNFFSLCRDARADFYKRATPSECLAPNRYLVVRKAK